MRRLVTIASIADGITHQKSEGILPQSNVQDKRTSIENVMGLLPGCAKIEHDKPFLNREATSFTSAIATTAPRRHEDLEERLREPPLPDSVPLRLRGEPREVSFHTHEIKFLRHALKSHPR
jgi:hypothetical protein